MRGNREKYPCGIVACMYFSWQNLLKLRIVVKSIKCQWSLVGLLQTARSWADAGVLSCGRMRRG